MHVCYYLMAVVRDAFSTNCLPYWDKGRQLVSPVYIAYVLAPFNVVEDANMKLATTFGDNFLAPGQAPLICCVQVTLVGRGSKLIY